MTTADSYNITEIRARFPSLTIKDNDISARGKGSSTDVIIASARGLINALNNLRWRKNHPKVNNPKGV